jgi:hypothetical protein
MDPNASSDGLFEYQQMDCLSATNDVMHASSDAIGSHAN